MHTKGSNYYMTQNFTEGCYCIGRDIWYTATIRFLWRHVPMAACDALPPSLTPPHRPAGGHRRGRRRRWGARRPLRRPPPLCSCHTGRCPRSPAQSPPGSASRRRHWRKKMQRQWAAAQEMEQEFQETHSPKRKRHDHRRNLLPDVAANRQSFAVRSRALMGFLSAAHWCELTGTWCLGPHCHPSRHQSSLQLPPSLQRS